MVGKMPRSCPGGGGWAQLELADALRPNAKLQILLTGLHTVLVVLSTDITLFKLGDQFLLMT